MVGWRHGTQDGRGRWRLGIPRPPPEPGAGRARSRGRRADASTDVGARRVELGPVRRGLRPRRHRDGPTWWSTWPARRPSATCTPAAWARNLRESRVTTTRVLARAIADSERRPAYLAGNAIAWYGDHGRRGRDRGVRQPRRQPDDERVPRVADGGRRGGRGRRAGLLPAHRPGDGRAPARPLKQLRLLTKLGLGARLGDGRQRMAMISLRDWVGGVVHLVEHDDVSGPVNLCCADDADQRGVHRRAGPGAGAQGVPRRTRLRGQARRRPGRRRGARLDQPPADRARGQRLLLPRSHGPRGGPRRARLSDPPSRPPAAPARSVGS